MKLLRIAAICLPDQARLLLVRKRGTRAFMLAMYPFVVERAFAS